MGVKSIGKVTVFHGTTTLSGTATSTWGNGTLTGSNTAGFGWTVAAATLPATGMAVAGLLPRAYRVRRRGAGKKE